MRTLRDRWRTRVTAVIPALPCNHVKRVCQGVSGGQQLAPSRAAYQVPAQNATLPVAQYGEGESSDTGSFVARNICGLNYGRGCAILRVWVEWS